MLNQRGIILKIRHFIFLVISSVLITSCSSCIKRQECASLNWYEIGYQTAMNGQRPKMNDQYQSCLNVGADIKEADLDRGFKEGMSNYCKPETVYATGKSGTPFNMDFCDPAQTSLLKNKHQTGINEYCSSSNSYNAGVSGKKYLGVCNANQEKEFLPGYKLGRKKYLNSRISDVNQKLSANNSQISQLNSQVVSLSSNLRLLPSPRTIKTKEFDTFTNQWKDVEKTEDPYSSVRSSLAGDIDRANNKIYQLDSENKKLNDELSQLKQELIQVD